MRKSVCVTVCVYVRESVCVCVCVRERERERERETERDRDRDRNVRQIIFRMCKILRKSDDEKRTNNDTYTYEVHVCKFKKCVLKWTA